MTGLEFADTEKTPPSENQDSISMGDLVIYAGLPLRQTSSLIPSALNY